MIYLIIDQELNNIIDSINEVNKNNLLNCHGRYHITFVINTIENLLTKLNFGEDIIELGKQDRGHSSLLNIEETILTVEDKNIIRNYIVNDQFSQEILSEEGKKGITIPFRLLTKWHAVKVF